METGQLTVFTLGQSTVVTLPKKWGIKPGSKITYKKTTQKVNLELTDDQIKKNFAYVKKHAGILKGPSLSPDELNRLYDEDVYESVLR